MYQYCYNEACSKDFLDLEYDIIFAKKAGFDLIEIRFDCLENYLKDNNLEDLKQLLEDTGLKCHALNALYIYPEFLSDKDDEGKNSAVMERLHLIETLYKELGIDKCIVVAPLLTDACLCKNYSKEEVQEACVRILKYLCTHYPQIQWIFEPVGLSRSLVQDADDAYDIIKEVAAINLGLVLDSYNLYLKDRSDNYDFSRIPASKIMAIHMMNGLKVPASEKIVDQRYRRFCDDGDAIDLSKFMQALRAIHYQGMLSTEVFNSEYCQQYEHEHLLEKAYLSLKFASNL